MVGVLDCPGQKVNNMLIIMRIVQGRAFPAIFNEPQVF